MRSVQVPAVNAYNDDALEIVVVSENSISIIYDLDDVAAATYIDR